MALTPLDAASPRVASDHPCASDTAVLTAAAYEPGAVPCHLADLAYSRGGQEYRLDVRGVGETYGHFATKVVRARQWIANLPEQFRYVMYLDATDTLLTRSLDDACAAFAEIAAPSSSAPSASRGR